ncbi:MAG: hypothetical protein AAGF56_01110 [Pseudomonadota bacterium]
MFRTYAGAAVILVCASLSLQAQTAIDPERKALFVSLVCEAGGVMDNATAARVLPEAGFDRVEMIEISFALEDEGLGVRDGNAGTFTLTDAACAE